MEWCVLNFGNAVYILVAMNATRKRKGHIHILDTSIGHEYRLEITKL